MVKFLNKIFKNGVLGEEAALKKLKNLKVGKNQFLM